MTKVSAYSSSGDEEQKVSPLHQQPDLGGLWSKRMVCLAAFSPSTTLKGEPKSDGVGRSIIQSATQSRALNIALNMDELLSALAD